MHAASPALLKVLAGHTAHATLLDGEQGDDGALPAAQTLQFWQGARPEALKVSPAAQGAGAQAVPFQA